MIYIDVHWCTSCPIEFLWVSLQRLCPESGRIRGVRQLHAGGLGAHWWPVPRPGTGPRDGHGAAPFQEDVLLAMEGDWRPGIQQMPWENLKKVSKNKMTRTRVLNNRSSKQNAWNEKNHHNDAAVAASNAQLVARTQFTTNPRCHQNHSMTIVVIILTISPPLLHFMSSILSTHSSNGTCSLTQSFCVATIFQNWPRTKWIHTQTQQDPS